MTNCTIPCTRRLCQAIKWLRVWLFELSLLEKSAIVYQIQRLYRSGLNRIKALSTSLCVALIKKLYTQMCLGCVRMVKQKEKREKTKGKDAERKWKWGRLREFKEHRHLLEKSIHCAFERKKNYKKVVKRYCTIRRLIDIRVLKMRICNPILCIDIEVGYVIDSIAVTFYAKNSC